MLAKAYCPFREWNNATLTLAKTAWSQAALRRALIAHPLMTAKVIGAIHWQALRLYLHCVPAVSLPADSAPEVAGRQVLG